MDVPSDLRLITELVDRHAAALELYASQWTTTPEDTVQETFIALASLLQEPGSTSTNPIAWLYQVVRNKAHNAARADRRRQHHEQIAARLQERVATDPFASTETQPLLEALDNLSTTEREIVVLRVWSELPWQEIANLADTSSSSAQRRYVAALKKLHKQMETPCRSNLD